MKRCGILIGLLTWFSLVAIGSSARAELVVNGDFESTTFNPSVPDGWVASGAFVIPPRASIGDPVVPPASGGWAVDLGPSGIDTENGGTISQTFSVTTPGIYTFRFEYTNESHNPLDLADFSWFLSGAITDSDSLLNVGGGYQTFSQSFLVNAPGDITIGFSDIVGNGHGFDAVIDNVSFAVVPEPSSSVFFLLAGAGLALWRNLR